MAQLYDCFTFFNELDLLEIRLNELAPVVDSFVIAESPVTFQGNPKPLYFRENRERFAAFDDHIRHVVVEHMPEGASERDHWRREYHQRNALMAGLGDAGPEDLVLLSDVDEIPRADLLRPVIEGHDRYPTVHCFELAMFTYFVNYRHDEPWLRNGPRLAQLRNLRSMQGLRDVHPPISNPSRSALRWISASVAMGWPIRRTVHAKAGWHFSSMGGIDQVAQKLRSFSHVPEERVLNPNANMVAAAKAKIDKARLDKALKKVPLDESFPSYLLNNQTRFSQLIASEDS